jgi:P pilus assembly chaperone PapD
MVVEPGSHHRQTITVQNVHQTKTLSLTVGVSDWALSDQGELELLPPGTFEEGATDWVRFSPAYFSLKPGQSRQVQVDFSIPIKINRAGERKMSILVSTILPAKKNRGDTSGVWNRFQVASLFYLALPGAEEKALIIDSVSLQDKASIIPVIEYSIENPSDYHARLKGQLIVKNSQGKSVFNAPIEGVLMAKQKRHFTLPIKLDHKKLPAGEYQVEMQLKDRFSLDKKSVNKMAIIKTKMPTITVNHPIVSLR